MIQKCFAILKMYKILGNYVCFFEQDILQKTATGCPWVFNLQKVDCITKYV